MNRNKEKQAIKAVAKQHGMSVEETIKEMEKAIIEGYSNPDEQIRAYWKQIPCKGEYPTPEELIVFIVNHEINSNLKG
ncbi:MAG: hypothetical protein VB082_07515 [Christensenella sp.]|nr:hypothetical protein [Christensenella sp.]